MCIRLTGFVCQDDLEVPGLIDCNAITQQAEYRSRNWALGGLGVGEDGDLDFGCVKVKVREGHSGISGESSGSICVRQSVKCLD